MNLTDIATPRRWRLDNPSPSSSTIEIAGWEFDGAQPDKPILLMHHANGICGACWALVARELAQQYSVFAIDARGHGDSEHLSVPEDYDWNYFVSDLAGVARQLIQESEQSQIRMAIGSSFGGIVTAATQAQNPGLFEQIVMLDPPIHVSEELLEHLNLPAAPGDNDLRSDLVERTLKRRSHWASRQEAYDAWRHKGLFAPWQEEAFQLYIDHGLGDDPQGGVRLNCDPTVEAHIFATTGSVAPLDYAPKVDIPVTIVHAQTGFLSEVLFKHIATMFTQGSYAQLAGGHMLPLEVPELVVDFLLERLS